MASGVIELARNSTGVYLIGQIVWSSASNGSEANTSKVTATLQLQRYALNTTTGTFKGTFTVGGTSETISWYGSLPSKTWVTIKTITVTVNHNASGAGSCYMYAKINGPGATTMEGTYVSGSQTVTLDTIPRQATLSSAANFNDEENPKITYSNPLGSAAPSLQAGISLTQSSSGVIAYHDVDKTAGVDTVDLTESERNTIRATVTGGNTRTVWIYLRTRIGETYYYSPKSVTVTIKNPNPTISPTIVDSNSTTVALTGDSSKLVRYYSNAAITIGASAVKGATLSSKKVTCGSKSLTADGTINAVESGSFVFTATDSRGNSTKKTVTQAFVQYVKLTCNLANNLPATDGSMTVKVTGNYYNGSFGSKSNSLTVYYRYKAAGGSYGSWTAMTVTKSSNAYSATASLTGLDYQTNYVFQAYAVDALATVYSAEKNVKSLPVFDWSKSDFKFNVPVYDEFGALAGNGLAAYGGGGDSGIDPNTTLEELCLTSHSNAPQGLGVFYYIHTAFYSTKSTSAARSQVAFPYNKAGRMYHRYYASGTWSAWNSFPLSSEVAPSGYGLGDSARNTTDLNQALNCGWYSFGYPTDNAPFGYGIVMVMNRYGTGYVQLAFDTALTDAKYNGAIAKRVYANNVWSNWEFVNPPMAVGVEYRTTERHQDKIVYTKLVNLSTLPNATTKTVSHGASATAVIRVAGVTSTGTTIPYRSGDSIGTIAANKTQIVVYYSYNASSATGYAQIWYTKD